jgi:hypothetical protein
MEWEIPKAYLYDTLRIYIISPNIAISTPKMETVCSSETLACIVPTSLQGIKPQEIIILFSFFFAEGGIGQTQA